MKTGISRITIFKQKQLIGVEMGEKTVSEAGFSTTLAFCVDTVKSKFHFWSFISEIDLIASYFMVHLQHLVYVVDRRTHDDNLIKSAQLEL